MAEETTFFSGCDYMGRYLTDALNSRLSELGLSSERDALVQVCSPTRIDLSCRAIRLCGLNNTAEEEESRDGIYGTRDGSMWMTYPMPDEITGRGGWGDLPYWFAQNDGTIHLRVLDYLSNRYAYQSFRLQRLPDLNGLVDYLAERIKAIGLSSLDTLTTQALLRLFHERLRTVSSRTLQEEIEVLDNDIQDLQLRLDISRRSRAQKKRVLSALEISGLRTPTSMTKLQHLTSTAGGGLKMSFHDDKVSFLASGIQVQLDGAHDCEPFDLPDMTCTIDYVAGTVTFAGDMHPEAKALHPHIYRDGSACWGTGGDRISELIDKQDTSGLVQTILAFLAHANADSPVSDISAWFPSQSKFEECRENGYESCIHCSESECPYYDDRFEDCYEGDPSVETCALCSADCPHVTEAQRDCYARNRNEANRCYSNRCGLGGSSCGYHKSVRECYDDESFPSTELCMMVNGHDSCDNLGDCLTRCFETDNDGVCADSHCAFWEECVENRPEEDDDEEKEPDSEKGDDHVEGRQPGTDGVPQPDGAATA